MTTILERIIMFNLVKAIAELAVKIWLYTFLGKLIGRYIDKLIARVPSL